MIAELAWLLTYSGRFNHISGRLSATGRAQDRENSSARDRHSTSEPRNQHKMVNVAVLYSLKSNYDLQREVDYLKSCLKTMTSEHHKSDEVRRGLTEELNSLTTNQHRLEAELDTQRHLADKHNNELHQQLDRQQQDNDRW